MRKVWYHQIWIQNYSGFIVSDLTYIPLRNLVTFLVQNTRNSNCCLRNSNMFYWHSYCCHIVQSFAPPLLWPKHFSLFAFFLQAGQEPKQIWRQIPKRLQDWKEKLIKDVVRFTQCNGGSFWQKEGLLQQNMTLLQGPKDPGIDPVLPSLVY